MKKTHSSSKDLKDVLFEIGTEELPATNLADIFESGAENILVSKGRKVFEDKRIAVKDLQVWATPRRLTFYWTAVAQRQASKETMVRLLSRDEAYTSDDHPSEKLLAILRHRNVSVEDIVVSDSNGKPYIFIKKSEAVRKTQSLLPEMLEALIKSLPFPKTMKWGLRWADGTDLYFPRPIRSFLCFYGEEPVKRFKLAGIEVMDKTFVFSKGQRKFFHAKNIQDYFRILDRQGIVLDPVKRKEKIQNELKASISFLKGRPYEDAFLLNEVNFLVENPAALTAPFDAQFLKLPLEVLTVSMARKQRLFGLLDKGGQVLPQFVAMLDGPANEKEKKSISKNYEHILQAKLQDSLFFYREDLKTPLEKKRQELKNLTFMKHAGSMLEKSERLEHLAKKSGPALGLSAPEQQALERAATLSKADLLTQMVGEFPELQGVMGKYYAEQNGENVITAQAIGEQYLPRTVNDRLPESKVGGILSMLDKCDLIAACFALGLEPSSSLDPYALRRSGAAAVKITLDKGLHFSLTGLMREILSLQGIHKLRHLDEKVLLDKLCGPKGFFWDRFRAVVVGPDIGGDMVDAVTAVSCDDFLEVYERAGVLSRVFRDAPLLKAQACKVVERTVNILKGSDRNDLPEAPDPALFTEELERQVFKSYQESQLEIQNAAGERDFKRATSLYAGAFFDILEQFFEKVFVNAEDLSVRKNRFALLRAIKKLYTDKIADLSKIHLT